jgi:hypothetical protein
MNTWEYCDVTWQPEQVIVTRCAADSEPRVKSYDAASWPKLLAKLGAEGWELVSTTASPMGMHEYYFYFKRPLDDE